MNKNLRRSRTKGMHHSPGFSNRSNTRNQLHSSRSKFRLLNPIASNHNNMSNRFSCSTQSRLPDSIASNHINTSRHRPTRSSPAVGIPSSTVSCHVKTRPRVFSISIKLRLLRNHINRINHGNSISIKFTLPNSAVSNRNSTSPNPDSRRCLTQQHTTASRPSTCT